VRKDLFVLVAIIAVFLAIGVVMIATKSLPEEDAKNFHTLSNNLTLNSGVKIIKEPTPGDNTLIYAINDVAEEAYNVAQNDAQVKQIIDGTKGKVVTIAAVQPTLLTGADGQLIHSSGGQVIITANWQLIDGRFYSDPASISSLQGKQGESHQQIWSIMVDLDKRKVIDITRESERVLQEELRPNLVYAGMNVFLPDAVKVSPGTTLKWSNESNVPHNVIGIYRSANGSQVAVDSGFIEHNRSWQYSFNEQGVFEYRCTIHSEEGMKGTIIVSPDQQ
jgi:plastocyanin